jgi:hypothetical protein
MKVLIIGSPHLDNYYKLVDKAIEYAKNKIPQNKITRVGYFDNLVKKWAENNDLKTKEFLANWLDISVKDAIIRTGKDGSQYNARAGFDRNKIASEWANALIAIYKEEDRGLDNLIELMKDKKVVVYEL